MPDGGAGIIALYLGRIIGLVVGFTIHEYAHSRIAYELGDRQQVYSGRMTLDPRAHLEPAGIILAILIGFGWAKPVPVNVRAFYPNEQRGLMFTALAGPVSNLVLGFALGFVLRILEIIGIITLGGFLYDIIWTTIFFNFVLFAFNLIPLSPLDGWKILLGLLPSDQAYALARYERESTFGLLLLLMLPFVAPGIPSPIGAIFFPILRFLMELSTGAPF